MEEVVEQGNDEDQRVLDGKAVNGLDMQMRFHIAAAMVKNIQIF
jgi:hypothetical protein